MYYSKQQLSVSSPTFVNPPSTSTQERKHNTTSTDKCRTASEAKLHLIVQIPVHVYEGETDNTLQLSSCSIDD